MKLGVEFKDKQYDRVAIDLKYGNDGIGGTEYSILKIAYMYAKKHPEDEIIAFHYNSFFTFNKEVRSVLLSDDYSEIEKEKPDILLTNAYMRDDNWYNIIEENDIKLVLIANNFPSAEKIYQFNSHSCIKRIVFKSGQEADVYFDDDISDKEAIIGNILYPCPEQQRRGEDFQTIVTYMGALVPGKGFHLLAKEWKKILKKVPNAELHVIGSGALYNKDEKLGVYGVASAEYEDAFMPYLTNDDGEIMSSVVFHGIMGNEKYDILRKTAVGVPNPSGVTETFCNVAVEMQDVGIPVVTIAGYSFFDVVDDKKTGFLYSSRRQFRKYIIDLLCDREKNIEMGEEGHRFVQQFYSEKIIQKWEDLFLDILSDKDADEPRLHGHYIRNRKFKILINAFVRKKIGIRGVKPMNQRRSIKRNVRLCLCKMKNLLRNEK